MWKVNGVVFLSFFLALVTIACCTALVNNWLITQRANYGGADPEAISVCSFICPALREADLEQLKSGLTAQSVALTTVPEQVIAPGAGGVDVRAVIGDLPAVFEVRLSEGRFFTAEELRGSARLCTVGAVTAQKLGVRAGDSLTLRGKVYQVIGIASIDANQLDVLVPMGAYFEGRASVTPQQTAYCIAGTPLQQIDFERAFLGLGKEVSVVYLTNASALQAGLQQQIQSAIKAYGAVGLAAFTFSVINIYLILKGKFNTRQYLYALQCALGAKRAQLFAQLLCENMLLALAASGTALWAVPAVLRLLDFEAFYFEWSVVAGMVLVISLFTSIAASLLLFFKTIRLPIVEVLQREASQL